MSAAGLESPALWFSIGAVQFLGLVAAAIARFSEGAGCWKACHGVFLGCLAVVGLMTAVSVTLSPGYWLMSGTGFSVMVLSATWDFGRPRAATADC